MTAFILPDDDSSRIITFDVIESESHETVAEVTDHPVEVGLNISDHIRPLPDRLSLTGYTTNQPIFPNPITQRGEVSTIKFTPATYTIPVEPTPGALYRAGIQALGSLFGPADASVQVLTFAEPFNAIWETYEVLRELQANGVLLRIITPIRFYESMVIERVLAPRGAGDAGVAFGLDVRRLRIVESGKVEAPPVPADDVPGGIPLQNKGGQGAKPPSGGEDEAKSGSIAFEQAKALGLI
jgi:hypothetical protein